MISLAINSSEPQIHLWIKIAAALVIGTAFLIALTFVPRNMRKPLIGIVTFIGGLFFSLEYFIPGKSTAVALLNDDGTGSKFAQNFFGWLLRPIAENKALGPDQNFISPMITPLNDVLLVISGFTFALGLWNLIQIHGKAILKTGKNYGYSILFFVGLLFISITGFLSFYWSPDPGQQPDLKFSIANTLYDDLAFQGIFVNLDAAMFSLIAFFIISAAYRAFRVRSLEAGLMLVSAFIVMLGQVPLGLMLTGILPADGFWANLRLEHMSRWIFEQPNAAAQRAINFGLAVGALAMGLRIWLSLERGSYFEQEA